LFSAPINIGAKGKFNRVFEYARGKYFKWIAADDVCGPRYLELTVAALDQDPTAVLAHTYSRMINSRGEVVTPEELGRGVIFDEGFSRCRVGRRAALARGTAHVYGWSDCSGRNNRA
jgi:GT2 family glycosyltransferase